MLRELCGVDMFQSLFEKTKQKTCVINKNFLKKKVCNTTNSKEKQPNLCTYQAKL